MRTEEKFPQEWAKTENNIGYAWSKLPGGDRAANISRAIAFFDAAMRVFTEETFPEPWAHVQKNLGDAWRDLPAGNHGANLRIAIDCFEAALRVYTKQGFPREHKETAERLSSAHTVGGFRAGGDSE